MVKHKKQKHVIGKNKYLSRMHSKAIREHGDRQKRGKQSGERLKKANPSVRVPRAETRLAPRCFSMLGN
jgi:hypothetical protein